MNVMIENRYEPDWIAEKPILFHGTSDLASTNQFDDHGAREPFLFRANGHYYMHYDGNGPTDWGCCLAESNDLIQWTKKGRVLTPGQAGARDAGGACYGPTFQHQDHQWYMYYVSVSETSGEPWFVPALPYRTGLAVAKRPDGPWKKLTDDLFGLGVRGTWNDGCICAPYIVKGPSHGMDQKFYAFYSGSNLHPPYQRSIGLAVAHKPEGPWTHHPDPVLPLAENLENPALHFESTLGLWFMFVNHVHQDRLHREYTDAIWVYWSDSLSQWDPANKAVVLDKQNIPWAKEVIGLPACLAADGRLWIAFDASSGSIDDNFAGHMHRDIGLCSFTLPLRKP